MPQYLYACQTQGCPQRADHWLWTIPAQKPEPPACLLGHGPMERDFHAEHHGHVPSSVFPFMHPHISGDGTPVLVKSEAHYKEVLREYSLKRSIAAYGEAGADPEFMKARPDKAFIDDQVVTDPQTYTQKKVEGSGAGHPGCWTGIPALLTKSQEEIDEFFKRG